MLLGIEHIATAFVEGTTITNLEFRDCAMHWYETNGLRSRAATMHYHYTVAFSLGPERGVLLHLVTISLPG
jgi:hypothetical protein